MNIINYAKKQKRYVLNQYNLWKEYRSDYNEYKQWQYNNPKMKTQNAIEAKILRQTHVIEKGMSLSHPKEKFGVQKATELLAFIDEFVGYGYKIEESISVLNAIGVLNAYLEYQEKHKFKPKSVLKKFKKYSKYLPQKEKYGIIEVTKDELKKRISGRAGLTAHLGTTDIPAIIQSIEEGDKKAELILDAMIYNVAKAIGASATVLCGKIDAILLTGGIAYSDYVISRLKKRISFLAPIYVYPGENEMESLAFNAIGALKGELPIQIYK